MSVFVTGIGAVSAMGIGVKTNYEMLKNGQSGIKKDSELYRYVGRLGLDDGQLKELTSFSNDELVPRTALLGMLAAEEAWDNSKFNPAIRTGFINGCTTGGMDLSEQYFKGLYCNDSSEDIRLVATHDLGTVTNLIAQKIGSFSYVNTISTACSSSANSILLGARMIEAGLLDRALVGGCDALTQFTIDGFSSLMIYSNEICTPFDENRTGLNLGEGAGYILLENEKSIEISHRKKIAQLTGWSNANDAHHQTGTSPEGTGARIAMKKALDMANLDPAQIGFLNAHGTATKNNDESEAAAIQSVFDKVDFSSTKGFTGHTLGASGGVEAVFSVLSLINQCIFENVNLKKAMHELFAEPIMQYSDKQIDHAMSNSFGFGGNSSSLIFSNL